MVFRAPSRGGRGRWADVGFVVCFRWGGIFRAFHEFAFSNSYTQSSQRRIGEGAPAASQSAHRELAPTYPRQVYRLVCSHLRSLASAVDQNSNSQPASLIFDPTSECNLNKFFQASRAPVAFAREKEHSGRHTQEGRRGMCFDTHNPGGEVRGCCVCCILGMPEISPFVFIAASYQLHGISRTKQTFFQAGTIWVGRNFRVF